MKPKSSLFLWGAFLGLSAAVVMKAEAAPSIQLTPIGTAVASSPPLPDSSPSEIVAYDPETQRIFVVNAVAAKIDVFIISNPQKPKLFKTIDVKPYGSVANSVAIRDGYAAVAVEGFNKTDSGSVVFFRTSNLKAAAKVTVGALPDMVTFSPDGRYVITANEGEPSLDYSIDPEGSVSIIDISGGIKDLTEDNVRNARFNTFDKQTLLDAGIRVFGPGASVAQDMEPEYVAVSADSKTAYVTLQENNAIAKVDLATAQVSELLPLGYKDHAKVGAQATLHNFDPAQLPSIGSTAAGQSLNLGGFSGLFFEGVDPVTGEYNFITHTDRGPNAEPTGVLRPFLLPQFQPRIVRFKFNPSTGALTLGSQIPLQIAPGVPLTGISNTAIAGGNGNTPYNDEVPVDLFGNVIPLDPLGADLEGIAVAADGSFWMTDEYRPAIYHFSPAGVLIDRFVPIGTAAAAGKPAGTYGKEVLPAVLAQRRQNRGFEGVALDGGKVYAFVQSPVRNPVTVTNAALGAMQNVRIVEFDPATEKTRQFLYIMDNADLGLGTNTRADKIGDAVSLGNGEFLLIERDDDKGGSDDPALIEKKIYRFNLTGATDISGKDGVIGSTGKTVDQLTVAELVANKINPIEKILQVDLNAAGYNQVEKVEGLAVIDPWTLAVINDNDFGVAQITVDQTTGTFARNYVPEPEQLGIIHMRGHGLDASDADNKINIRPWKVRGLYMPDTIASLNVGGQDYLITANEGDAREYLGNPTAPFVEAARVRDLDLDPVAFPNAAVTKANGNLGKLNVTKTLGLNPVSGKYDALYSFGSRSFSIWAADGTQVYDSGEDFEWITAGTPGIVFNASNSNNTFDNRSDDKGPEPEALTTGVVYGRTYAFIGLERVGGIMVYDVTDPTAPEFVQYVNRRDFTQPTTTLAAGDLGPEGMIFIAPENSPNGKPLVVVANEISGTTTIFEINATE